MNVNEQQAPPAAYAAAAWPGGHRIGNFELQSAMLRGSTAVIYRAWDHALSRPVAIKEYLPASLAVRDADGTVHPAGPDAAEGFETGLYAFVDEARVLARCDHPSLVRVLDLIETHGTAYRVMPWYSGRTLRDVRRKMTGPIGEPALRMILDNLIGALEAFHQVGGVHRGVGPSQAMLLDANRALLMGPGAASRGGRNGTGSGAVNGANRALAPAPEPGFAPPEQGPNADGQPQGPWTDFYALAAVARFCITGVPPSAAGLEAPEPLAAAVERMFARQSSVQYDRLLLETLDSALARDVTRRLQSAAQFRERLMHAPLQAARSAAPQEPPPSTVDEAMAEHIHRVVDAIPEPNEPAPWADPHSVPTLHAEPHDRGALAAPPRRKRGLLWAGVAGLAAVVAGYGGLALLPSLQVRDAGPPPTTAGQAAAPSPAAPALTTPAKATDAEPPSPAPTKQQATTSVAPAVVATPAAPESKSTVATVVADASAKAAPAVTPAPTATSATKGAATDSAARTAATSPRQECGARTEFSLYRCMQAQCSLPKWQHHPQCERLRATDTVE